MTQSEKLSNFSRESISDSPNDKLKSIDLTIEMLDAK